MEQYLLSSNFSTAIIASYTSPELSQSTFESMLEPLQKLVRLSPPIAASLAVPEIFSRTVQKLGHKDAVTRLNLLRIIRTICDATEDECTLIKHFGVYTTILNLSDHDPAILVRQMAEELVRACDEVGKRSMSRATGFRRPASSAGLRAGSGSSNGSTMSGKTPSTPSSVKSTFSIPPMPPPPNLAGTERERERRIGRSQSTGTGIWDLKEESSSKPPSLARSSTAMAAIGPHSTSASSSLSSRGTGIGSRPPSRDTTSASSLSRAEANRDKDREKSRLPKARQGRLSEAVSRRRQSQAGEENAAPGAWAANGTGANGSAGNSGSGRSTPLPRLQIVRRRRETSGGEMGRREIER